MRPDSPFNSPSLFTDNRVKRNLKRNREACEYHSEGSIRSTPTFQINKLRLREAQLLPG